METVGMENSKGIATLNGGYDKYDKYDKMEAMEYYDDILQSKHVVPNEKVGDMLWQALLNSPFTKGELAERLDWSLHKLMMIMSGDDTIDTYDMVHVAGA